MATMLIKGLIAYAGAAVTDLIVTRKNKDKLFEINEAFPDIHVAEDASEVVRNAKLVFICVKPMEVKDVLLEMKPYITRDSHIISLAGMVSLNSILSMVDCMVSKLTPSIVSEIGEGISLICYSAGVAESDRQLLRQYMEKLGRVKIVDEEDLPFAVKLTSCNPGLIASILDNMTRAAAPFTTSFTMEEIIEMVTFTACATTKLLLEKQWDYNAMIERVATKGGITEEGVLVLNEMLPGVFDKMFKNMFGKGAAVDKSTSDDILARKDD